MPNFEAHAPPVYYAVAGAWYRLCGALGLESGGQLYFLRFMNVAVIALLVWLAWWFARYGFPDRTEIRIQDFRNVTGTYDKVVSIEMIESIPADLWPSLFDQIESRLRPNGRAAFHADSPPTPRGARHPTRGSRPPRGPGNFPSSGGGQHPRPPRRR